MQHPTRCRHALAIFDRGVDQAVCLINNRNGERVVLALHLSISGME
jgi:hypothetical protein